jgi:hypothetical protein
MLTLTATLPLLIAMMKRPALHDGIRHFTFVIPLAEIKRDDVVFGRVYDIRGRSISSLKAIPAP